MSEIRALWPWYTYWTCTHKRGWLFLHSNLIFFLKDFLACREYGASQNLKGKGKGTDAIQLIENKLNMII
jgi:hypothetical protein